MMRVVSRGRLARCLACLAYLVCVAMSGCQSLSALECPGGAASCTDAGPDATSGADTGADSATIPDSATGGDTALDAPTEASDGGSTSSDSAAPLDASDGEAASPPVDAGPDTSGIACMLDAAADALPPATYCPPMASECCYQTNGHLSCGPFGGCTNGTDIECDKPAQCADAGGTCWMCIQGGMTGSVLGTSCSTDTLITNGCMTSQLYTVCSTTGPSGCDASTCKSMQVYEFPDGWFHTCQ